MSAVCLSCTTGTLFHDCSTGSNHPSQLFSQRTKASLLSSTTLLPFCIQKFELVFTNGNWVSRRSRFFFGQNLLIQIRQTPKKIFPLSFLGKVVLFPEPVATLQPVYCLFSVHCSSYSPEEIPLENEDYTLEEVSSSLSSLARLPWESKSPSNSVVSEEIATVDPPMRLQPFEFEACPFCRRVWEATMELDLSVEVYPCSKGSVRHREIVRRLGGKEQFPSRVDPNTGVSVYESAVWSREKTFCRAFWKGWMPTILRAGRGMTLRAKARLVPSPKKLELFSYENNPRARIVREALCELELPFDQSF